MREPLTTQIVARFSDPVWPLVVLFVGLPVWWILGVWQLLFFVMAIPMLVYLVKQRTIEMPRGFWIWLLFVAWLLVGVLVLQVNAPYTVPGVNLNRYVVFAYRVGWYAVSTIVALYVVNTRHILSTERIMRAVAWFFVMLVAGGLLGLAAPNISFDSVLQALLPHSLATHSLVHGLTHVQTAQVHSFLGDPQARPSAPFPYTNDWGFAIAITLPLFVAAWWQRGGRWRVAVFAILPLALLTVVSSLNRGTWIAILATVALAMARAIFQGRLKVLVAAVLISMIAAFMLVVTPLGGLITARLEAGHSDEGRANLAGMSVQSTAEGSPVVGFGTTRDLAGTFSSIAGGASDACPGCEPPPVGTHGQLWHITFTTGFVGAFLYVGFFVGQFLRHLRARAPYAAAALGSVLVLLVTMPIYNAIGVQIYMGFLAIGILNRDTRDSLPSMQRTLRPLFRHAPTLVVCAAVGVLVGYGVHAIQGSSSTATQRVLVSAVELVPVPGVRTSTLDAEAMLAMSSGVVSAIAQELGISVATARDGLSIGAEPNTRVMIISFQADSAERARIGAETALSTYLEEREALLTAVSSEVHERYTAWQAQLDDIYRTTRPSVEAATSGALWDTLNGISRQWSHAASVATATADIKEAQAISSVTVTRSTSERMVRLTSGLALGLLVGVPIVVVYDRRVIRLGRAPQLGDRIPIPIVARIKGGNPEEVRSATSAYAPLAGLVADPTNVRATELASRLDQGMDTSDYLGRRVMVVVDPRSRAGHVNRMIDDLQGIGLDPVGILMCESGRR